MIFSAICTKQGLCRNSLILQFFYVFCRLVCKSSFQTLERTIGTSLMLSSESSATKEFQEPFGGLTLPLTEQARPMQCILRATRRWRAYLVEPDKATTGPMVNTLLCMWRRYSISDCITGVTACLNFGCRFRSGHFFRVVDGHLFWILCFTKNVTWISSNFCAFDKLLTFILTMLTVL